ncbi:MAG: cyclodeaminase/cyclohydrolase family protein [Clostridia bacterium]|nr:cyclodeaminase/cyclohydrolase family protein [Clostridia bacterium]
MKLVDMKVTEYLDILRSDAPAPGGGSVSALAGAQGFALFMMVADLTLQKPEKYADGVAACKEAVKNGTPLYEELIKQVDRDTDAFNIIANAFKMPKSTDEEKQARRKAIDDGTLVATEVPFNTMKYAFEGLKIAETLVGVSNPNAASDLGVAFLQLMAAIKGAWLNVKINLPGVKDEAKAKFYEEEGQKMYDQGEVIAKKCFGEILSSL